MAERPIPDEAAVEEGAPVARVYLAPIAPPMTLGLFGFFASTMVVSTWILGWWGTPKGSPPTMFEIAPFCGGVAQFAAGLWSFRARDYIGSALLTMWGCYWMACGCSATSSCRRSGSSRRSGTRMG